MKANEEHDIHLGNNIKHLMRAFQITQTQLADKLDMPDSHLCNLLQKANIDDAMLQRIADAIGYGVTVDTLKNYSHEDTINYIINNYTQNVEEGGNGTFIPKQDNIQTVQEGGNGTLIPKQVNDNNSTYEKGSQPTINHYTAEKAFEYAEKVSELKSEIMRLRMKYEPESVEKEFTRI